MTVAEPYWTTAQRVRAHLAGWGFPPEVQERLGCFGVVWGIFETKLEATLWGLRAEDVRGQRPSTDYGQVGTWIADLARGSWPQFSDEVQRLIKSAAKVADDLAAYRHAVQHGWMLVLPDMPVLVRNPGWNGEIRKRPSSEAHISTNLLDMAISSAWTLCVFAERLQALTADKHRDQELLEIAPQVRQVASQANELRHLSALVNSEKY